MTVDVIKTVKQTIIEHSLIANPGHVVLGLSGGPDSMCLFHVLLNLRKELGFTISTVHLNHRFRPGAAEDDQKFVEKICEDNNIYCLSKTLDINKLAEQRGETPEEAGRNERYKAFDAEAGRVADTGIPLDNVVIAVAQNKNDQAETVLMRILRGTGTPGLAGIPYKRESVDRFDIVRPLLNVDRKSIEKYCDEHDIEVRIDHTNNETEHHRNKIRLDLMPMLRNNYNKNVDEALIRLAHSASADKDYFENLIDMILDKSCKFLGESENDTAFAIVDSDLIIDTKPAIGIRLISAILKRIGLVQGLDAVHLESAYRAVKEGKTGTVIEFPQGYRLDVSYNSVKFYNELGTLKQEIDEPLNVILDLDDTEVNRYVILPGGVITVRMMDESDGVKDKTHLILDRDALRKAGRYLTIRNRKPGDRMSINGMTGSKKLQDIFVDTKIPRAVRDIIPIILIGNDILWVAGLRDSGRYLADATTKHCLSLEWKPNN